MPVSLRNQREETSEKSLVEQAAEMLPPGAASNPPAPVEAAPLPDGYLRVSPPQPYRTLEGYGRRIALKVALCALAAAMLLTLFLALMRNGILRF